MKQFRKAAQIAFPLCAMLVLASASATAAWKTGGTPVCAAANNQSMFQTIPDGAGGAIIVWEDYRSGNCDVYAQRMSSSGVALWGPNGLAVCTNISSQYNPQLASDESGGAIIVWQDDRSGSWWDIYAQRVNASGQAQWTTDGIFVISGGSPAIASDGGGGALIACVSGPSDIYAQRIDGAGARQWLPAIVVCGYSGYQWSPRMVSDGAGGAIVAWRDLRVEGSDVYAQRVNGSGVVLWDPNGVAVCTAENTQWFIQLVSDGAQGAIIAWGDTRQETPETGDYDVYAQRVDASGNALWTPNGAPISTAQYYQWQTTIAPDGAGGAVLAWQDSRNSTRENYRPEIFAQRVNASGTVQWAADGIMVSPYEGYQEYPSIMRDNAGEFIITWQKGIYDIVGSNDVLAQKLNASGELQWAANGVSVCSLPADQGTPMIVPNGVGGALIAWNDTRNGTSDIYASRATAAGGIPSSPRVTVLAPNGGEILEPGGRYNITWSASDDSYVSSVGIIYSDNGGLTFGYVIAFGLPNTGSFSWIVPRRTSRNCLVRVAVYDSDSNTGFDVSDAAFTIGEAVPPKDDGRDPSKDEVSARPGNEGFSLSQNVPNPFNPTTRIPYTLTKETPVRLEIFDTSGRLVRILVDARQTPGGHAIDWDGRDSAGRFLSSGIYFCKLRAGGFEATRKLLLLR